jgi:hypothetical protein
VRLDPAALLFLGGESLALIAGANPTKPGGGAVAPTYAAVYSSCAGGAAGFVSSTATNDV